MWIIAGPFDSPAKDEFNFTKRKVLKPGKSYTIGRKNHPLVLNSKKISVHENCVIIVGDYPLDNASDPTFMPTLQIVNKRTKTFKVHRGDDRIPVGIDTLVVLQHNDKIAITSEIELYAIWEPVCFFVNSPKLSLPLESLASLAISIVYTHNLHVTHHITRHCDASPAIATSLLSTCSIVTPEWVNEVVRIGALSGDDKDSLEFNFQLPSSKKYYPKCAESLDRKFHKDNIWLPNESRLNLFKSFRFLCLGDQSRQVDSDLRLMIERGGGAIESFNVQDGVEKWKGSLSRGVAKEGAWVLAIADQQAMTSAVGKATWDKFIGEATNFRVGFSTPMELIEAVLMADDTSLGNKSSGGLDASQSSIAPREEESMETPVEPAPPPARRKPPRRAASRQPSQEVDITMANPESINAVGPSTSESSSSPPQSEPITVDSVEDVVPARRKLKRRVITQEDKEELGIMESTQPEPERRPLTRRAQGGLPVITGIDDHSVLLGVSPDTTGPPPETETPASTSSSLPPPRRQLKRRRETVEETLDSQFASLAPKEEPSYKKHKALFDSLEPDNAAISFDGTAFSRTQFGSDTPGGAGFLRMVHEEEETQTQSTGPTQSRGQKRKASEAEDVEMEEVGEALQPRSMTQSSSEVPPSKKRAVENVNAVDRLPTTLVQDGQMRPPPSTVKASESAKPGADSGKPDTDAAFLKAIASTKRGKKNEDEFDREFNKLKISKPDLEKDAAHEQWKVLDDFGDDTNIRGNFMVVVPLEVYTKDDRAKSRAEPHREWDGLPNFKKFKKKVVDRIRSAVVGLVVSDPATLQSTNLDQRIDMAYRGITQITSLLLASEFPTTDTQDFAYDDKAKKSSKGKGKAKAQSPKEEPDTTSIALFDSDDEEEIAEPVTVRAKTKQAGASSQAKAGKGKGKGPAASKSLFIEDSEDEYDGGGGGATLDVDEPDDDDDDAETLRSQSVRPPPLRASRTKKPVQILVAEDSDDDVVVVAPVRGGRRR